MARTNYTLNMTDTAASPLDDNNLFICSSFTLTAAQIIGMFTTPLTIIPAPGANRYITVSQVSFQFKPGTTNFTGGGALNLQYHGGAQTHAGTILASVVTSGSASTTLLGPAVPTNGTTVTVNAGIDITNATGAFATGNGTAVVTIQYTITTLQ